MPARKMSTPGSYNLADKKKKKRADKKVGVVKKKGRGSSGRKGSNRKENYLSRYTPEEMDAAYYLVIEEGWNVSAAAREMGVPRVTLINKVKGTHKTGQIGRPKVLTKTEEETIVDLLILMGQFNYPLSKRHLQDMVQGYLEERRDTRYLPCSIVFV